LPAVFYDRDPREVAPDLLGKLLVRVEDDGARTVGRIVEVEAYCGADDPGSHAYRGETPRTRTMFGPPGGLYVYFSYGMHWCANAVCRPDGTAGAVLLRALAPVDGVDRMHARRGPAARRDRDLCSGPAKLCQALGVDRRFDGTDLTAATSPLMVFHDETVAGSGSSVRAATAAGGGLGGVGGGAGSRGLGVAGAAGSERAARIGNSVRVGLSAGREHPWRWFVEGDPNVSRGPRSLAAPVTERRQGGRCR
jgi:DNA-3-methyladenine glycosylase